MKSEASPFPTSKVRMERKTVKAEERQSLGQREALKQRGALMQDETSKQREALMQDEISKQRGTLMQRETLMQSGTLMQKETSQQKEKGNVGQKKADAEQLAKALDYFMSRKYHECLLILQSLNERYKLNPRYKAYLGICYYYEWDFERCITLLDEAIPQLQGFAPQERSLYYWMDAESHFNLQRYQEAMPLYEEMLKLCHENERPDAYYRLGFCHLYQAKNLEDGKKEEMLQEMKLARENFEQALAGYLKYRNTPDEKARIAQIQHMMNGLK